MIISTKQPNNIHNGPLNIRFDSSQSSQVTIGRSSLLTSGISIDTRSVDFNQAPSHHKIITILQSILQAFTHRFFATQSLIQELKKDTPNQGKIMQLIAQHKANWQLVLKNQKSQLSDETISSIILASSAQDFSWESFQLLQAHSKLDTNSICTQIVSSLSHHPDDQVRVTVLSQIIKEGLTELFSTANKNNRDVCVKNLTSIYQHLNKLSPYTLLTIDCPFGLEEATPLHISLESLLEKSPYKESLKCLVFDNQFTIIPSSDLAVTVCLSEDENQLIIKNIVRQRAQEALDNLKKCRLEDVQKLFKTSFPALGLLPTAINDYLQSNDQDPIFEQKLSELVKIAQNGNSHAQIRVPIQTIIHLKEKFLFGYELKDTKTFSEHTILNLEVDDKGLICLKSIDLPRSSLLVD